MEAGREAHLSFWFYCYKVSQFKLSKAGSRTTRVGRELNTKLLTIIGTLYNN